MGSMRLGELSVVGKIVTFLFICGIIGGAYYGYVSYKYNSFVESGNASLSNGDYSDAISDYNNALEAKSFWSSQTEIASLINRVNILRESEVTRLQQEIVSVIGDRYGGIEGSNAIAIRKGYYAAIEIESIQNKIDRLIVLSVDNNIIKQYQHILNSQKYQSERNKR